MKKNMAFGRAGNTSIVAHSPQNPSPEEWDAMLDDMRSFRVSLRSVLVYSEGGSPNAIQRKKLRDVLVTEHHTPKTIVLTTSTLARVAVTAINLFFDNKIKAVEPASYPEGLEYLEIPLSEWPALMGSIQDLANSIGLYPPFGLTSRR